MWVPKPETSQKENHEKKQATNLLNSPRPQTSVDYIPSIYTTLSTMEPNSKCLTSASPKRNKHYLCADQFNFIISNKKKPHPRGGGHGCHWVYLFKKYETNYLHYVIILFSSKNEEILLFIYSRQQGSVVFPLLRNEEN